MTLAPFVLHGAAAFIAGGFGALVGAALLRGAK